MAGNFYLYQNEGVDEAVNMDHVMTARDGTSDNIPALILVLSNGQRKELSPSHVEPFFKLLGK